jgi:hypothetical protein
MFVATWQSRRQIKRAAQYPGKLFGYLMLLVGEKNDDRSGHAFSKLRRELAVVVD